MLSIADILEKTGLTLHTFQSWRRGGSNLLPKPVAVDKKVIFFDDSILERIRFIREQRAAGKTLDQIKEMISAELAEEAKALPTWESLGADHEDFMGELREFTRKWEKGECRDEVLAALKLDPLMSGQPVTFVIPAIGKPAGSLTVYVTIISTGLVQFAELSVDLYDETVVNRTAELPADDYAMLLYIIGREFAVRKQVMKTEMIPYLLFHGFEGTGATAEFWMDALDLAPILNQVTEASRQYLLGLREKGGEFTITTAK
ncbi:helix-turn-helix domain-containing protein [Deltaproteobacteria bacterium OttesenSCG-928-M10]|nr:helix-turn-helix domain-containing protein [Deltaproteobacteria bacterium OttesenSCG-928-M10]